MALPLKHTYSKKIIDNWAYDNPTYFAAPQNKEAARTICENIGLASIFASCLDVVDWVRFRHICEYDMCAHPSNKVVVCSMMAAMAHECQMKNVEVDWQVFGILDYCRSEYWNIKVSGMQ